MKKLTPSDWNEIYYAVQFKLSSPAVIGDERWENQLLEILDKIGIDGETAAMEVSQ